MIPTRIRHKGICAHPQTPYARRTCRAAALAAAKRAAAVEQPKPRYRVETMQARSGRLWYVIDNQTGDEIFRSRDERSAVSICEARNRRAADAAETPAPPAPAAVPMRAGWSKAAQRLRRGSRAGGHPLGEVVEVGAGYTMYRDTAFGGGQVQIWDRS